MTMLLESPALAWSAFIALAALTPLAGALLFARARHQRLAPRQLRARLLIGLAGPLVLFLWLIYNGVVAIFELDSLAGLGVNFALFTVLGVAFGLAWRRWC